MRNFKFFVMSCLVIFFAVFGMLHDANAVIYYPFSLTAGNIATSGTFEFKLSASGTFYVDCGANGTLSSDDSTANAMISGVTITKNDTTEYTFKCTYSNAGTKTIQFGGNATAYTARVQTSTISFYTSDANAALVSSISGDLSPIFPNNDGATLGAHPIFYKTFYNCTNLTEIPSTLFSGYTSSGTYMFYYTFQGCTSLTSIPESLFNFGGNNVSGRYSMFENTFAYNGLTSIPENLFQRVTSSAFGLFHHTFQGCAGLISIPKNLFNFNGNSVSGEQSMFNSTFKDCVSLTSIPANLFQRVTSRATNLFYSTFSGCTNITGYIPPSTFAGLITNSQTVSRGMWSYTFADTQLDTSCPIGKSQYITGYEDYWDGHVSCQSEYDSDVSCDNGVLHSYNGSVDLEIDWQPNTIDVRWYNDDNQLSVPTNAQSCSYDGSLVLPTAPSKKGYTFEGWEVKSAIPEEYTELQYLQSSGTQWIDTGVLLTSDNITYQWNAKDNNASGSTSLFGTELSGVYTQSSDSRQFSGILHGSRSGRAAYLGKTRSAGIGYACDDAFHSWSWVIKSDHNMALFKDGIKVGSNTWAGELVKTKTIILYANRYSGTTVGQFSSVAYKYFKILDNGQVVFNGVPVRRNSDNALGMYDTVSGHFLSNSGTGTFTAGPVVQ